MVIGLLVTGDGIPIAHPVLAGKTKGVSALAAVSADLQARFAWGGSPSRPTGASSPRPTSRRSPRRGDRLWLTGTWMPSAATTGC